MKIKAKIKAFYQGSIIKPGDVVEFGDKKLPSWATLADAPDESGKKEGKDVNPNTPPNNNKKPDESGKKEVFIDPDTNNADKLAILNTLQTEGIALNLSIDTEGKTIQQQIDELTALIEKTKTEQKK